MKPTLTKKALWTTLRAWNHKIARAAKAKAAKLASKAAAKRAGPRKRIPARSEREIERQKKYIPARDAHLAEFPNCQVCLPLVESEPICALLLNRNNHPANQVHHVRGRSGPLLWDRRFFKSSCADGHAFIDANRNIARKKHNARTAN